MSASTWRSDELKSRFTHVGFDAIIIPMREIIVPVRVRGNRGEKRVRMLFDTGATSTFIRADIARAVGIPVKNPKPIPVVLADGSRGKPVRASVTILIEFKGVWLPVSANLLEECSSELILGCFDMEQYDIRPIPRNGSYTIPKPKLLAKLI
ncbi:MAG: retroviral-like aspartic protease [Nitrospirae bacterium]|nr:retroviral-like aspartic protease [Nitrospirota bacterium]